MKVILSSLLLVCACSCSRHDETHAANNKSLTPMDQSESEVDRELTREIRKSLLDEPALSSNAKNVKVITQNGKVTLRGIVDSQPEKDEVSRRARAVAGVMECDNQLEVKRN